MNLTTVKLKIASLKVKISLRSSIVKTDQDSNLERAIEAVKKNSKEIFQAKRAAFTHKWRQKCTK